MKNRQVNGWRFSILCICLIVLLGSTGLLVTQSIAKDKSILHKKAHALYSQKCLGCHDSVADPEKPGRTRDDWHLVVNVMHQYGTEMTNEESEIIIELLYDLRKGMEREAG